MSESDSTEGPDRSAESPPPLAVAGIGASAGGIAALRTLLGDLPAGNGLAWVVVVHLSPEHESHLATLLQPHVGMPIRQVTDNVPLEPGHVYVIPPNANLEAIDTHLRLSELEPSRRARNPIDHFFRTLSRTHGSRAVGIVLSGTGTDGTIGIRAIKEEGGLTVVQDPDEAEYDGMPRSAISSGIVDLVLPLAEIPGAVLRFARTEPRIPEVDDERYGPNETERLVRDVFAHVRRRTGRDFSRYKRSTLLRRIARRMQIRHVEELADYLDFLLTDASEVQALAEDLLITVTGFFRDPEVFEALEKRVTPNLFEDKAAGDHLRAWSVGCATGEEAYSLAMLLVEEAERHPDPPGIQVFATDLHELSLQRARMGWYPGDIVQDVSPGRLARFFQKEDGGYRLRKEIRDRVVFASHDLLSDPPFSRLDLVACRNVLIYLNRDVQPDVVSLFHYALRPGGFLVLGTSETAESAALFRAVDKKRCIYRKRNVPGPAVRLPVFPMSPRALIDRPVPATGEPIAYSELHRRLLEAHAPPSMLVSPDDEVVHLSSGVDRYLVHPEGGITSNAFRIVHEELRLPLRAALDDARKHRRTVRSGVLKLGRDDGDERIQLRVRPVGDPERDGFALVLFEGTPRDESDVGDVRFEPAGAEEPVELEQEVQLAHQRLRAMVEDYETSQQELRASNEELQSSNEELRSTLEELETSKEELQSMNEELQTVNQENRHKVEELARLTDDLQNLVAATDIAMLFLDRELRIIRFTPRVSELFSVRATDQGRPLEDLRHKLVGDGILEAAERVLSTLVPEEWEIEDEKGRWYLTCVRPYRSTDDRIDGVVITFVEITGRKRTEDQLRASTREARELAASLARAEQEERRRLAQLLHDDLQQLLYAIQGKLVLAAGQAPDTLRASLERTLAVMDDAIHLTRRLSVDLSPILDEVSLVESIEWLRPHMASLHDLQVDVLGDAEVDVPPYLRSLLFQVVRELLFNVAKHAGTDRATVEVEKRDDRVSISVSDEGRGFDPGAVVEPTFGEGSGLGIFSARERLRLNGGGMEIRSEPNGGGTTVVVYVPNESTS